MNEVRLPIIGYMHSPYKEKFGIPRQPNLVEVESYIEMLPPYNDLLAFEGIAEFSHLWLIWQFHENKHSENTDKFRAQVRPPRLGGNQKIGVFATRSMYRPAPLGLSVVKFLKLEKIDKSVRLYVLGSDLLDATPIVDIKPYIQYSDAVPDAFSGYAQDEPSRKEVIWSELARFKKNEYMQNKTINLQQTQELEQVLEMDPRPAYQNDETRIYGMKFANLDVKFSVNATQVVVVDL